MSTRDAAAALGITQGNLRMMLDRGHLARPAKDTSGFMEWSARDLRAARAAVKKIAAWKKSHGRA